MHCAKIIVTEISPKIFLFLTLKKRLKKIWLQDILFDGLKNMRHTKKREYEIQCKRINKAKM